MNKKVSLTFAVIVLVLIAGTIAFFLAPQSEPVSTPETMPPAPADSGDGMAPPPPPAPPAMGEVQGVTAEGCTDEVKMCDDGVTAVGRTGESCEFAACPSE